MPLTVLSIAYPFAPVHAAAVGGAEKILSDLDRALVQNGHCSIVVASEGSEVRGTLVPAPLPGAFTEDDRSRCCKQFQSAIDHALSTYQIDVIHMHGIDFHAYTVPDEVPTLVTLHMPVSWYPAEIWMKRRNLQFCCVSEWQRRSCPPELRNCIVIPNGVDLPPVDLEAQKADFALAMGRICPEKNQHAALQAGTLAGTCVLLAGQVYPYEAHRLYYESEIRPRLNGATGPRHRMLGPVESENRQRLLAEAECLLHPTLAPETSSLVALEALAAGTPVIAYPSGALRSIVQDGVTGFLVNNPEEMAEAVHRVSSISRYVCRRAAERFGSGRMVQVYLEVYKSMAKNRRAEQLCA
ncbi:glycosyltransferase [Terriglobus albidus]|uniref:glycosyltransferase n=1 Tax=Terriglobus albidus TaxID=1592106 RepID=UPI0021DFA185|nr:glycosyltransferase [Terriglobus albidus]